MTNQQISLRADQIKVAVDAIKRSNLPKEIKDLAILEAKQEIQKLKNQLEFNRDFDEIGKFIEKGRQEIKEFHEVFVKEKQEAIEFGASVKRDMEEARKRFFENWD